MAAYLQNNTCIFFAGKTSTWAMLDVYAAWWLYSVLFMRRFQCFGFPFD